MEPAAVIPTDGRGSWDPGGSILVLASVGGAAGILSESLGLQRNLKGYTLS